MSAQLAVFGRLDELVERHATALQPDASCGDPPTPYPYASGRNRNGHLGSLRGAGGQVELTGQGGQARRGQPALQLDQEQVAASEEGMVGAPPGNRGASVAPASDCRSPGNSGAWVGFPRALSLPPHVSFGMAEGFSLSLAKQAVHGNIDDVIETVEENVRLL
jgi:hypothetical protein